MQDLNNALAKLLVGFKADKPAIVEIRPGKVPVPKVRLPDQVLELKRKLGAKSSLPTRTVIVRGCRWFTPAGFELVPQNILLDYEIMGQEVKAPKIGLVQTTVPGPLKTNWPSKGRFEHGSRERPATLRGGTRDLS